MLFARSSCVFLVCHIKSLGWHRSCLPPTRALALNLRYYRIVLRLTPLAATGWGIIADVSFNLLARAKHKQLRPSQSSTMTAGESSKVFPLVVKLDWTQTHSHLNVFRMYSYVSVVCWCDRCHPVSEIKYVCSCVCEWELIYCACDSDWNAWLLTQAHTTANTADLNNATADAVSGWVEVSHVSL